MSAACLSWATICIAPCDRCFGWIRFGYWAGRGEGSDDCNVLNHVQSFAGLQQACLRFEIRFFVWREVVQAVFCHRCHSSCQTLKDRGAWTLLDSNSRCPHSAAYHNIARWGEGSNVSIGQQSGWNVIHDRCSSAFNVFVFGFENGQTTAPKMGVEICHRTGAIGRGLPSLSFWWEDWTLVEECLVACSETLKGWMARFYFECGSRSFRFNIYIEIRKKRFKISSHFGSRKATTKMGVGAVVIAKVNEAWRLPPFWGQETTPKTEAALCVFLKVLLGIRSGIW